MRDWSHSKPEKHNSRYADPQRLCFIHPGRRPRQRASENNAEISTVSLPAGLTFVFQMDFFFLKHFFLTVQFIVRPADGAIALVEVRSMGAFFCAHAM